MFFEVTEVAFQEKPSKPYKLVTYMTVPAKLYNRVDGDEYVQGGLKETQEKRSFACNTHDSSSLYGKKVYLILS